jgi:Homeodomain-like domain
VANTGVHEHTVGKWRRRFLKDRSDGLLDEARPGRPRTINDDQVAAVIEQTLRTTPADATHWSIRSMAAELAFPTPRKGYGFIQPDGGGKDVWSCRQEHFLKFFKGRFSL